MQRFVEPSIAVSNADLMKKGLKPAYRSMLEHCSSCFKCRPDEEGIETSSELIIDVLVVSNADLMKKGLKHDAYQIGS